MRMRGEKTWERENTGSVEMGCGVELAIAILGLGCLHFPKSLSKWIFFSLILQNMTIGKTEGREFTNGP